MEKEILNQFIIVYCTLLKNSTSSNFLGFHHRLEVFKETHVPTHVGGQHNVDHHLPYGHPLFLRQASQYDKSYYSRELLSVPVDVYQLDRVPPLISQHHHIPLYSKMPGPGNPKI